MQAEVRVAQDPYEFYRMAAEEYARRAQEAMERRGRYVVALSGGATPEGLFRLLATDPQFRSLPWKETHVFWGDERHVPPEHPDSNYLLARRTLLDRVSVPPAQIHRIEAELEAGEAARRYETTLQEFFGDEPPRFDFALMGLGPDGHTASLFPHSAALSEQARLAVENRFAGGSRITLTVPVFRQARCILYLVMSEIKAPAVQATLQGPRDPETWPAQLIEPVDGELIWLLDRAAASRLKG